MLSTWRASWHCGPVLVTKGFISARRSAICCLRHGNLCKTNLSPPITFCVLIRSRAAGATPA